MGNYVNNHLINGEQVEFETSYHWIIFFNLISFFTLGIYPLIKKKTAEFAITNKRVVVKAGLLSRKTLEMNLSKIESVRVDQSIFARLLGYGTITIIGSGGTKEAFPRILNPLEFRKKFQEYAG
ncbi:PH domain-containing protein [Taibaiella soli]|uniref:PH domain-containing protein n=1 Tax=Taibaiella soli TaxID=1649169 RepID=A0A2W2BEQ4_9BACT|nr:PH domain-containing protein [Taibaiella soli]PZF74739.1 PH domain-containing protein [Taibaiella soli]